MKKRLFIWMILLVLILSGCAKNEGMYVEPAQLTQEELTRAAADCDALKQNARGRLEQAAQLIVGRVVER